LGKVVKIKYMYLEYSNFKETLCTAKFPNTVKIVLCKCITCQQVLHTEKNLGYITARAGELDRNGKHRPEIDEFLGQEKLKKTEGAKSRRE
jgi:hypothetical protein